MRRVIIKTFRHGFEKIVCYKIGYCHQITKAHCIASLRSMALHLLDCTGRDRLLQVNFDSCNKSQQALLSRLQNKMRWPSAAWHRLLHRRQCTILIVCPSLNAERGLCFSTVIEKKNIRSVHGITNRIAGIGEDAMLSQYAVFREAGALSKR